MATGLGAGELLDAVVVRSLLVPALVGVLGRGNWYLPDWLARTLVVRPSTPGGELTGGPPEPELVGSSAGG